MILAHFPGELASFTVFCSVLFNRRQEYVKLAPGFVASERTCSYQFSWLQTVKKNIHIGIFDFWLECDFPKCGTAATTSQNRSLSAQLSPPAWRMPGPSQMECLRLKVVLRSNVEIREALRNKGFSAARISQLLSECSQNPPRSAAQRERQTAQDQKKAICLPRKKYLNSTNDAPSAIYIYISWFYHRLLEQVGWSPMNRYISSNNDLRTEFIRSKNNNIQYS